MPKKTFFNLDNNKKDNIKKATYRLFTSNPYENVNIRDIVKEADIPIGSFYRYFDDKDDLYLYFISLIEEKISLYENEYFGSSIIMKNKPISLNIICTKEEIQFNQTWYKAPIEVMVKFYFGEYSDKVFNNVYHELNQWKMDGHIKDHINVDFAYHMFITYMFNLLTYFRKNNMNNHNENVIFKKNFCKEWFLNVILKNPDDFVNNFQRNRNTLNLA